MSLWHGPKCDEITRYYGISMETKENELIGFYREFKLSELLQAAIKAQMSLWHGPKCDEITRYYGISMEQLRHFYELVLQEFKLSELLQAAIKAQMSLWHGPKCDEITRYYGISMEQLRHFYELVLQEGLVSGSLYGQMQHQLVAAQEQLANYEQKIKVLEAKEQLYRFYLDAFKKQSALSLYGQMQHQLVAAQEQLANYEQKIKVLEAKEQLYRFYLDAFKKQSALYKLDFNSLNDALKQDFLSLIQQLRASGMTTQEAADMLGINMRTYYRWYKLDFNSLNDALKQDFLSLIQQLRASGMTTQEAADMLGINMRTYYRWLKQVSPEGSDTNSLSLGDSTDSREIASNSTGTLHSEVASLSEQPSSCQQAASEHNNINQPTPLVDPNKTTGSDKVLHVDKERPEYKFISTDEIELIKEIVLLPEYQGLNVRDCYHKLKDEQLLTMSLSTFYRTINQDPSLKAALKGKLKQSDPTTKKYLLPHHQPRPKLKSRLKGQAQAIRPNH